MEGEANPGIDHAGLQVIHYYKTGRLLSLPLVCAALLAGHREDAAVWERIGADTGLSFQIQDDILDVISTTEVLGKPVHSDEKNEKMTYVVWKGLDAAKQEVEHLSRKAISDVRALNPKDDYLEILLESLIYREK